MCVFPRQRARVRRCPRRVGERRRRVGLPVSLCHSKGFPHQFAHVEASLHLHHPRTMCYMHRWRIDLLRITSSIIERTDFLPYSEPLGSSARIYWLQPGCSSVLRNLFLSIPGLITKTTQVCDPVGSDFSLLDLYIWGWLHLRLRHTSFSARQYGCNYPPYMRPGMQPRNTPIRPILFIRIDNFDV